MSKPPTQKKIMEMMQFTLRKQIENNNKNIPTTNPCLPKDIPFEWIGKTQPSQEVLTHIKPLCYTAVTVGNLNVTHQEDASESMMCFRSQEPHTPNPSPSATLKKTFRWVWPIH